MLNLYTSSSLVNLPSVANTSTYTGVPRAEPNGRSSGKWNVVSAYVSTLTSVSSSGLRLLDIFGVRRAAAAATKHRANNKYPEFAGTPRNRGKRSKAHAVYELVDVLVPSLGKDGKEHDEE